MSAHAVDFLFVLMSAPKEHETHTAMGDLLRQKGFRVAFVTQSERSAQLIREAGFQAVSVTAPAPSGAVGYPSYEEIERTYRLISIRDLCRPESLLLGLAEEVLYDRAVLYFQRVEACFDLWRPRYVVQNSGAELLRRTAFFVSQRRGVTHIFLRPTPFKGRLTFSINCELGSWTELHFSAGQPISQEEQEAAHQFVSEFLERKTRLASVNKPKLSAKKIRDAIGLLSWQLGAGSQDELGYWNPLHKLFRYSSALFKSQFQKLFYDRPRWNERYIFFPIHVWHDSAITVRAPQFLRQHQLVETIAGALPQGYKLFIKEHPASVGRNPLSSFLALRKLPNVVILDPGVSSHQIVEHASAVVAINSTAGFEALAYHKPTVILGRPFYSRRGVTFDVENLFDLRAKIKEAFTSVPHADQMDAFFYAAYRTTFPGTQINLDGDLQGTAEALAEYAGNEARGSRAEKAVNQ